MRTQQATTSKINGATRAPLVEPKSKASIPEINDAATVAPSKLDILFGDFMQAQALLLEAFPTPSWIRKIVAFVTAFTVGAGIGWIASTIVSWLMVGALTLTGSTFLAMAIFVMGLIVAVFYGGKIGGKAGMAVYTGDADRYISEKWNSVKSWFAKPSTTSVVAASAA